jgi:hypothetical protein
MIGEQEIAMMRGNSRSWLLLLLLEGIRTTIRTLFQYSLSILSFNTHFQYSLSILSQGIRTTFPKPYDAWWGMGGQHPPAPAPAAAPTLAVACSCSCSCSCFNGAASLLPDVCVGRRGAGAAAGYAGGAAGAERQDCGGARRQPPQQ